MIKLPWQYVQVVINVATVIFGLCTVMPISYIRKYFTGLCVLYADIRLSGANGSVPSLTVDMVNSVWGSRLSCDFPTYTPVVAGIHAFIWCWYFLLMKNQLQTEHKEFPLLAASLLTHAVMFFPVFVTSCMISAGSDSWCHDLVTEVNKHVLDRHVSCYETQDFNWTNIYQTKTHHVQDFLLTSEVSSWIQTLSILVQTVVCGYILYGWVLQSSDDQQNANNNNSGKKNDKLRRIFKRKKNPVPKEPKEKGKKGVHVPEIHIPDIHIYRQKGWTQYSRLDDDEEEDNNYNGDDEIV